jgi:K+-transporting ATPase KdpF subunit
MIFDYSLAALVTAGLLFYLTYALLRPSGSKRRKP